MSFLAPFWLLLGAAAAVPLVLHLMRRRIHTEVDFPAVAYLARAERENVRQIRMRNLLLMVLRILAVLLLAFAAARPLGAFFGAGHVPTALAVVIDNSLSSAVVVNGQPVLETLRAAAREAIESGEASDRLWLVTADGQVTGGSKKDVLEALARLDALPARGDLGAAVTRAAGLTAGAGLGSQQVAVITDGQATAWEDGVSAGATRLVALVPDLPVSRNHGVVLAEARPPRWTPGGSVVARVVGSDSATWRIALGSLRLASGTARGGEDLLVQSTPTARGWQSGVVELEPDELRLDDTRHFAAWLGDAPGVRVDPSLGSFAASAVDALVQSRRVTRGDGIALTSADAVGRLPALLVAPREAARVPAANRLLERLGVPWRFGAERQSPAQARGVKLDGTRVSRRYQLLPQGDGAARSDTLATAGGEAWIVAGEQFVLVGSPLDGDATDLPLRAGFVPWLGDAIAQHLSGEAAVIREVAPTAPIELPARVDAIEAPDGQLTRAPLPSTAPRRPGVYFLRQGPDRVGALVVNPEPGESDLARLSSAALQERLRGDAVMATSQAGVFQRELYAGGSKRPLQLPLILLALLILAAEAFVIRRSERDGS